MNRTTLPTALLALVVLSGCGSAAENAAAPSPRGGPTVAKDKKHQFEAVKADCMKQKGFKYVPYVSPEREATDDERKRASGDYQAMRKFREKYGFGVFSRHVYPKEMGNPAVKPDDPEINPNWKIQSDLSEPQMQAYRKAMDACTITAAQQVLGLKVKSQMDYYNEQYRAVKRASAAELDSDPQLVELAAAMATCLKGKGYAISKAVPTAMENRGQEEFLVQEDKLGRQQRDDVPDVAPPAKDDKPPMYYAPTLTPAQARPYLNKEIKAAVDDLDCGKDFYPAYYPKSSAVSRKINEQFGM
ncbi:hypothetical protein ABZ897_06890 [Nonomuraea sp. NPDC046802]|uniref:hypothetical protein n=1 Tax=Nonomuraea sp. NPDC046802 TaxID=3154919 RepID=UPI0033E4528C